MKFISVLGFLLFAATIHAQDLDRRPDAPKTNNLTQKRYGLEKVLLYISPDEQL